MSFLLYKYEEEVIFRLLYKENNTIKENRMIEAWFSNGEGNNSHSKKLKTNTYASYIEQSKSLFQYNSEPLDLINNVSVIFLTSTYCYDYQGRSTYSIFIVIVRVTSL